MINKTQALEERVLIALNDSGSCPNYVRRLPPCKEACPSSEDIRGYLTQVAQSGLYGRTEEQSFDEAWHILTDKNPFPAVHGRICPHPCEKACNRNHRDWPLAINNLERYIGDHGIRRGLQLKKLTNRVQPQRIAVVGAGPSGLSCAYQMARRGYPVTIFEASDSAGGMLRTGIPRYRLPLDVLDAEIAKIFDLGVEISYGSRVGTDVQIGELRRDFEAVYAAVGAQLGNEPGIEGQGLPGVYTGIEFLSRVNSGELKDAGERVLVIGGGNAAVDAARVARRLGASVSIIYRRSRTEMPAIPEELWEAEEEGVSLEFLEAPLKIESDETGKLLVTFIHMEQGEPDESGRPKPVPVAGTEFRLPADAVVTAFGQHADLSGLEEVAGDGMWGKVNANYESPVAGVFAGGDMVGPGLATIAVGQGRRAARAIVDYLYGRDYREPYIPAPVGHGQTILNYYPLAQRNDHGYLDAGERVNSFDEVNLSLSPEEAFEETKRCMSCGLCFACDRCRIYCCEEAISRDLSRPQGLTMFTDYAKCVGCGTCAEVCPCHYIEMG